MQECILADRLYVPDEYVTQDMLDKFIYTVEDSDYDFGPFATDISTVRTFNKVNIHGKLYYGFSRGNIPKLGELFGHLEWEDKTCAPPLKSNLQFKGQLHTWESKKIGQVEAVTKWLRHRGGVVKAPPRFGKTISSIFIITKLRTKTIIITHQTDLLDQFYKSFVNFTNVEEIQDIKPDQRKRDATGRIFGFFDEYDNPEELDVCLMCWQTFASKFGAERIHKYANTWGLTIVDECHRLCGLVYAKTVNKLLARYRLGLTGTVERTDGREFLLKDIIGPVVAEGKVETIPCHVTVIHTGLKVSYQFGEPLPYLYKRIFNTKARMEILLEYLEKDIAEGRSICFAFHRSSVAQLNLWTKRLQLLGHSVEAFYGSCRDREGVLQRARSGATQVLVCNQQMLTGIDVPRWDTYYAAFPTSNVVFNEQNQLSGNFYQEFSRIRTPYEYPDGRRKTLGLIRDFVDTNNFCFNSYRKRYKAYKNQDFTIDIIKSKVDKRTLDG